MFHTCPDEMLQFQHYAFHSLRNKKSLVEFLAPSFVCKRKAEDPHVPDMLKSQLIPWDGGLAIVLASK